jgi:methylphosphotriester-DNA--protein-cysteine methyltransferase
MSTFWRSRRLRVLSELWSPSVLGRGHGRSETARRLLEDTDTGIDHIARQAGYGTAEAMRRAFHRTLGLSPAEYRRRF